MLVTPSTSAINTDEPYEIAFAFPAESIEKTETLLERNAIVLLGISWLLILNTLTTNFSESPILKTVFEEVISTLVTAFSSATTVTWFVLETPLKEASMLDCPALSAFYVLSACILMIDGEVEVQVI